MKKNLIFLLLMAYLAISAQQQAGTIFSYEKKISLTTGELLQNITSSADQTYPQEFYDLLNQNSYGIEAYKITYWTPDYYGKMVKATGLVVYPKVNFNLSTVVYCHPTTDNRNNVPSNVKDVIGTVGFVIPLTYVLNGYIVIAPDYLGMGDGDGKHPYVNAKTEASSVIDMTRAANQLLAQLKLKRYNEYFITGYSQGGHAVMSTIKANAEKYNNLYDFKYVFAGAGPYDLSDTTINVALFQKEEYPFSAFLANVVNGCKIIGYNVYNTSHREIISDEYADKYEQNVINEGGGLLWGPILWKKMFQPSFVDSFRNDPNNPLRRCLKESDVYNWYNKYPSTLQNAYIDYSIPYQNAIKAKNVQQSYYPFWDLSKYKITTQIDYLTPSHPGGALPWLISSNYIFNTKRAGGFFNERAILQGKQASTAEKNTFNQSVLKPEFKFAEGISSYEVKSFDKDQKTSRTISSGNSLDLLEAGSYIIKAKTNTGKSIVFPYYKSQPIEVDHNQFVKMENDKAIVDLSSLQSVKNVFVYDENNNKLKEYTDTDLINGKLTIPNNEIIENNYTIEVVSDLGNNLVSKITKSTLVSDKLSQSLQVILDNGSIKIFSGETIKNVKVYDMNGGIVATQEIFNSKNATLSATGMIKGVYLVNIEYAAGKKESKKLIIK